MGSKPSRVVSAPPQVVTVVIVGAGYAGVDVALSLDNIQANNSNPNIIYQTILIDVKKCFVHSVGALRAAVTHSFVPNILVPYDKMFRQDGTSVFINAHVRAIKSDHILLSNHPHPIKFNYLVISTGSSYTFPCKLSTTLLPELYSVQDITQANIHKNNTITTTNNTRIKGNEGLTPSIASSLYSGLHKHIAMCNKIIIVGGGTVGIELAGEISEFYKEDMSQGKKSVTIVHAHELLCNTQGLKKEFSDKVLEKLKAKHVNILFKERLIISPDTPLGKAYSEDRYYVYQCDSLSNDRIRDVSTNPYTIVTTDKGTRLLADLVFFCTGSKINISAFKDHFQGKLNSQSRLQVNSFLQVEGYKNIFALGDCAGTYNKLAFLCYGQAATVSQNIQALTQSKPLCPYKPMEYPMCLVSLGPHDGVGQFPTRGGMIVGGTITGFIKAEGMFVNDVWKKLKRTVPSKKEMEKGKGIVIVSDNDWKSAVTELMDCADDDDCNNNKSNNKKQAWASKSPNRVYRIKGKNSEASLLSRKVEMTAKLLSVEAHEALDILVKGLPIPLWPSETHRQEGQGAIAAEALGAPLPNSILYA